MSYGEPTTEIQGPTISGLQEAKPPSAGSPEFQALHAALRKASGTQWINPDAQGAEAFIYHPAFALYADGSASFAGALSASAIDIGGSDATSWHVDSDGNHWFGASADYATAVSANAPHISSTGSVYFPTGTIDAGTITAGTMSANRISGGTVTAITIAADSLVAAESLQAGTIASVTITASILTSTTIQAGSITGVTITIGANAWHVDASGNMWWGTASSYANAVSANDPSISSAGAVYMTSGTFAGDITGATGTFAGAITASSIDIGGTDTSSWHVDSAGNMWWGDAGSYAAATQKISAAGEVALSSGVVDASVVSSGTMSAARISGGTIGAITITASSSIAAEAITTGSLDADRITGLTVAALTITTATLISATISAGSISGVSLTVGTDAFHMDSSGNMWWGSAADYASATIKISAAGSVDLTTGTFSGDLSGAGGTFSGTVTAAAIDSSTIDIGTNGWHVDANGNMWWGSSSTYAGATIKISSAGSATLTTGTFSGTVASSSFTAATATFNDINGTNISATDIGAGDIHGGLVGSYGIDSHDSPSVLSYGARFETWADSDTWPGRAVFSYYWNDDPVDDAFDWTLGMQSVANLVLETLAGTGGSAGATPTLVINEEVNITENVEIDGQLTAESIQFDGSPTSITGATVEDAVTNLLSFLDGIGFIADDHTY